MQIFGELGTRLPQITGHHGNPLSNLQSNPYKIVLLYLKI